MFDFDAGKLLIIGVIALIVIGPKELPRVLRQVGQTVGKLRRMAAEFQGQFMDAMKEADIQGIKDDLDKLNRESALDVHFDPARDIQAELTRSIDKPAPDEPPAHVPGLASPTADFTIPSSESLAVEGEGAIATIAAAGLEPVAADAPADAGRLHHALAADATSAHEAADAVEAPAVSLSMTRKRKIMLPKRRAPRARVPLDVCDRTRVGAAVRLRLKAFEP